MTITCDHLTEFGYGVFCSSSGTLWQLGPDLHSFHGWSCAGVPSWRKAELKAPVWLPQAGETKERALQTVVKATWLTRNFFVFVFEERQNKKINSGT